MKRPRNFPDKLPPGTKVTGIDLGKLGFTPPAPTKTQRSGSASLSTVPAVVTFPVLALDVSSSAAGWAATEGPNKMPSFGLVKPPAGWPSRRRIDRIVDAIADIVTAHQPAVVVMEWADGKTARRLAKASGLSVLGAAQGAVRQLIRSAGIEVHAIPQNEWTASKPKQSRARVVRLGHPEYARWADEHGDDGLDVSDALGLLSYFLAHNPPV